VRVSRRFLLPLLALCSLLSWFVAPAPAGAESPGDRADSPFGLATCVAGCYPVYGDLQRPIDAVAGTGAAWAREMFGWDRIEPADNAWDWGFTDEMVDRMTAKGINVVGLLGYSVAWASGGGGSGRTYNMPDLEKWSDYVYTVVSRYKGRVRHWEIWNEPNIATFWQPGPNAADYTLLLKASYGAVKRADPSAQVLLGGPSSVGQAQWLDAVAKAGGWSAFDILAIHPYVLPMSLDKGWYDKDLKAISAALASYGSKPIWATEIGWSSASGVPDSGGLGSEERQANYLIRQYIRLLAWPGIEKVFVHNFRDSGDDPANPEAHFGLVRADWTTPKQAYLAYRNMTQRLEGAHFAKALALGSGISGYRFTRGASVVDVIWTTGAPVPVSVPTTAAQGKVYGINGDAQTIPAAGGRLAFVVGSGPVFLEH
jgi:polysaccharide biosynthesis protein PslG